MITFPFSPRAALRATGLSLAVILLTQCAAPISVRTVKPAAPAGVITGEATTASLLNEIRDS